MILLFSLVMMASGIWLLAGSPGELAGPTPTPTATPTITPTLTPAVPPNVHVWDSRIGKLRELYSEERLPVKVLALAGIALKPQDRLLWDGLPIPPEYPLPEMADYFLQYYPAVEITLLEEGNTRSFTSSAPTLGQALWQNGVHLGRGDSLSMPVDMPLKGPLSLVLQRGMPLQIEADGRVVAARSAAPTVGLALAQAGIPLQGLDFSLPAEDQPLPGDGLIRVVRVREEVLVEQKTMPYEIERRPDPESEIGTSQVVEEGRDGLQVTRLRVRYEDGQETSRQHEAQWVAVEPVRQIVSYGTKIVYGSVPGIEGGLEFWKSMTVYATSYYPCGFANGRCSYVTASGATLEKGIIAVSMEWYKALKGQRVYVPGYGIGVIADAGGGIPGKDWIDLGYGNEDYVGWSKDVTIYFLNPPPDVIPAFMQ